MKMIIVLAALVAVALAAPQKEVETLRYEFDNIGVEGYKFAYETSDGTSQEQQAEVKNVGTENEALVVRGSYTFVADDGLTYTVNYVADENGFQPEGAHLPKV